MKKTRHIHRCSAAALTATSAFLAIGAFTGVATAQFPDGGDPGPGVVIHSPSGGVMEIDAAQLNSFIDWDSFNLGSGNTVEFHLPDGSSRILNTVDGPGSFIDGSIWSNGVVYIVNPAGVTFGPDSFVDVGGIYAAAASMTKQDFMDGVDRFTDLQGEVVNEGVINAEFTHLIGQRVANHGMIDTGGGGLVTMLAANNEVYFGEMNGKLFVKLDGVDIAEGGSFNGLIAGPPAGDGVLPAVENTGKINADNGRIVLGAGDMFSLAIRNTGSLQSHGGQIDLAATNGTVEHSGDIGGEAVSFSGDEIRLDSDVHASGLLKLHDPTVIGQSLTLNAGGLQAWSTIDAADGANPDLLMTGSALLMGKIGQAAPLGSLTIDGAATMNGELVRTTGTQTYNSAVTLGNDMLLQGAGVQFNDTVDAATDGAQSLLVNSNVLFNGEVGETRRLSSLNVSGAANLYGGLVRTTGTQTYHSTVTLGADTTLEAAGVFFQDVVDAATAGMQGLDIQGSAFFSEKVGGTRALNSLSITGPTGLYGGLVRTTGTQNYNGAVTLGSDMLLQGAGVMFNGTVDAASDGGQSLLVNSNVLFNGEVGETRRLSSLNISGAANLYGGLIRTTGTQTYHNAVTLGADTTLEGAGVFFSNSVDAATAGMQGLDIQGSAFFSDAVGETRALSELTVAGSAGLYGGSVYTTGAQQYQGAVTLGADTMLSGSTLLFGSTVDAASAGGQSLTLEGDTVFDGVVGGDRAIQMLLVDGNASINGGSVTTTGDQQYLGAVMIDGETLIESLQAGELRFADQVDGDGVLRLETEGLTALDGPVGQVIPLIALETDAAGQTEIGGDINAGSINFGNVVMLTGDATLSGDQVIFASTVDGGYALIVNAADLLEFGDNVGSNQQLAMLETNVDGLINIFGNEIKTVGDIRLNPNGRDGVPTIATIAAHGDLDITSAEGDFMMGQGEKLTALGDLQISAMNGAATLSDLNTLGDMTVMSPEILLQTRNAGTVLQADGEEVSDEGLDFVAGGNIFFLVAPTTIGDGSVQFASGGDDPDANETLRGFTMRSFGDVTESQLLSDGIVLDLAADGPGFGNVSEALAAEAAGLAENAEVAAEPFLPTALQRAALQQLAINVRDLRAEELRAKLAGADVYNDSPESIDDQQDSTTVAANRLRRENVARVLDRYADLFLHETRDEETGEVVIEDRMAEVRETIADAWGDFRRQRRDAQRDPQAFVAYLEGSSQHQQALADLRNLRTLFQEMENLGLTRAELSRVRLNVLANVTPADLMPSDLENVLAS